MLFLGLPVTGLFVRTVALAYLNAWARGIQSACVVYLASLVLILFSFGFVIDRQWPEAIAFFFGAAGAAYLQRKALQHCPSRGAH